MRRSTLELRRPRCANLYLSCLYSSSGYSNRDFALGSTVLAAVAGRMGAVLALVGKNCELKLTI